MHYLSYKEADPKCSCLPTTAQETYGSSKREQRCSIAFFLQRQGLHSQRTREPRTDIAIRLRGEPLIRGWPFLSQLSDTSWIKTLSLPLSPSLRTSCLLSASVAGFCGNLSCQVSCENRYDGFSTSGKQTCGPLCEPLDPYSLPSAPACSRSLAGSMNLYGLIL